MYDYSLDGMSIAANNIRQMVGFYNKVFNAALTPSYVGDYVVFRGNLGRIQITLTPNELLGIHAERSLVQLSFVVSNLEEAVEQVENAGGNLIQGIAIDSGERYCGVSDPDGNTIELIELLPERVS